MNAASLLEQLPWSFAATPVTQIMQLHILHHSLYVVKHTETWMMHFLHNVLCYVQHSVQYSGLAVTFVTLVTLILFRLIDWWSLSAIHFPGGGLSWLHISFLLHITYTVSYGFVPYRICYLSVTFVRLLRGLNFSAIFLHWVIAYTLGQLLLKFWKEIKGVLGDLQVI